MPQGPVVGPFDKLIQVGGTTYKLSGQGPSYGNPPTGAGSENGKVLSFNSNSAVTVTIPVGLTMGFQVEFYQAGTGTVTYQGTGGVVINGITNGIGTSSGQYTKDRLQSIDQDVYILTHNTTTTVHS